VNKYDLTGVLFRLFQALKALQFFRVARVVGGESTGFDCYTSGKISGACRVTY
jgi:hypothetical protein